MVTIMRAVLVAFLAGCHPSEPAQSTSPTESVSAAVSAAPSASSARSPLARAAIQEAVRCDDAEWTVLAVRDLGCDAKGNGSVKIDAKHTAGRFVEVRFIAKNVGSTPSPALLLVRPRIVDAQGRAFDAVPMESAFVPKGARTTALNVLAPGESREYATVIDVTAADASNLSFEVRGFAKDAPPKLVALGI